MVPKIKELIKKMRLWWRQLPEKKPYVEFITAILTVPVLLTVIINNVNTLKSTQKIQTAAPTPAPTAAITDQVRPSRDDRPKDSPAAVLTPTTTPVAATPTSVTGLTCKKTVGPVAIASPDENQTVTTDPVTIDITYQSDGYCAVVWSYRINSGSWSDYTDKSISLYGMPSGTKVLELKVKSIASGDEVLLKRTFTYVSPNATPTPAPTATPASTPVPTPTVAAAAAAVQP